MFVRDKDYLTLEAFEKVEAAYLNTSFLNPLEPIPTRKLSWRPQRDSNPRYRRERAMS
jgi:hypothetical protein